MENKNITVIEKSPSGKVIEKIFGVTKRCKLFVSPTKISIRYKIGVTPEEIPRIDAFLLKAATMVSCDKTVRGHLGCHRETDTYYIVLQDEAGTFSMRISETKSSLL